jgi:pimeloyl-ACP methyl ester carboxylesterase
MLKYYKASFLVNKNNKLVFDPKIVNMNKISVPTLVVWGEQDKALSIDNLANLNQWVADLKIVRIPDKSHWLIHEDPTLINDQILQFIKFS